MTALRLSIAFMVLLATVSGIATADTYDIDETHDLSCTAFQENGSTSDQLVTPNAKITLTESYNGDGFNKAFFKIGYEEDLEHTVRIYIPKKCLSPYAEASVTTVDGDGPKADYSVVQDGKYLSITVTLSESGTYVYPISKSDGFGFSVWRGIADKTTGDDSVDSGVSEWQYIDQQTLGGYGEKTIETDVPDDVKVQRQKGDRWVSVGDDPGDGPVFVNRSESSVTVVSTVEDAPQVRYNLHPSTKDSVTGLGSGIGNILDSIGQDLNGLFSRILGDKK